jgi:hypothetical protein
VAKPELFLPFSPASSWLDPPHHTTRHVQMRPTWLLPFSCLVSPRCARVAYIIRAMCVLLNYLFVRTILVRCRFDVLSYTSAWYVVCMLVMASHNLSIPYMLLSQNRRYMLNNAVSSFRALVHCSPHAASQPQFWQTNLDCWLYQQTPMSSSTFSDLSS